MHESGRYLSINEELVPADNRVECAVPKGGVLLLSNRVIHGSFKNSTNGVRWSMGPQSLSRNTSLKGFFHLSPAVKPLPKLVHRTNSLRQVKVVFSLLPVFRQFFGERLVGILTNFAKFSNFE